MELNVRLVGIRVCSSVEQRELLVDITARGKTEVVASASTPLATNIFMPSPF